MVWADMGICEHVLVANGKMYVSWIMNIYQITLPVDITHANVFTFLFSLTDSWKTNGLDCTHNGASDGINGMHRFFLQAMVDDFLEEN
jgi:hypothetical protein